jgi:ribonuclease P protein component
MMDRALNAHDESFRFPKAERLYRRKDIEELFKSGSSFFVKPIQLRYVVKADSNHNAVLIVVPKRQLKKAVHRNLIKRRMREAYRLNKHLLQQAHKYNLAISYFSSELLGFDEIESKLVRLLKRLSNENNKQA